MKNVTLNIKVTLVALAALLLSACGSTPQPTVALQTNIFAKKDLKVGFVYNAPTKKPTTHIYGASCLLCYGVASALTSSLDKHIETTITDDELTNIKELVISEYAEKGVSVELVTLKKPIDKLSKFKGELGFATKDFRVLKKELNVDLILVLNIYEHGAHRSFSQYIPNGDPQGYLSGLLYSVDLNTNAYVQFMRINEKVQPTGEWDEPPAFPNVTTSYYQAIENIKQKIKEAI